MAYGMEVYIDNAGGTPVPILYEATPYNLLGKIGCTRPTANPVRVPVPGVTTLSQVSVMTDETQDTSLLDYALVNQGGTQGIRATSWNLYNGGIEFHWSASTGFDYTYTYIYWLMGTRT